jgi:RimJ/RimL family protein N-acetyltransferase
MTGPAEFRVSETLRNGVAVTIRALRPEDREKIARAVRELDRESIYTRLFTYRSELTEAGLERIMRFDPDSEVVLIATIGAGDAENVIGSARYVVHADSGSDRSAEVAFMVEEDYHGLGIASRLLRHLSEVGRAQGIARFDASVLPGNKPMLSVFARSGLPMQKRIEDGEAHVTLTL